MKKSFLIVVLSLSVLVSIDAQEGTEQNESQSPFSLSANMVSRYVWRGLLYSANPNIQPTLTYTKGGFCAGAWGSYAIAAPYAEFDLFASYTLGSFTATVLDYYTENETDLSERNYFNWKASTTPHAVEGSISFNGTENFPVTFSASTFVYGNDWDSDGHNQYSTYIEAGYNKQVGSTLIKLFVGGTPATGIYSDNAAIVNLGIGISHSIAITDKFKLPVFGQVILNPDAKDIFFVYGITL
jgi:hypothetical protein